MLITPESSYEHDLLLRRFRALQYIFGPVPLTVVLPATYHLTIKPPLHGTNDQIREW